MEKRYFEAPNNWTIESLKAKRDQEIMAAKTLQKTLNEIEIINQISLNPKNKILKKLIPKDMGKSLKKISITGMPLLVIIFSLEIIFKVYNISLFITGGYALIVIYLLIISCITLKKRIKKLDEFKEQLEEYKLEIKNIYGEEQPPHIVALEPEENDPFQEYSIWLIRYDEMLDIEDYYLIGFTENIDDMFIEDIKI